MAFGTTIGDVIRIWADLGVFAYALPFLLIFAIVFGILSKSNMLGANKGVQATVALAVGLLALQFDYVTRFYETIFPYAGIGLGILLIALIFLGFINQGQEHAWVTYVLFAIGVIIFLVFTIGSLTEFAWLGGLGYGFVDAWPALLAGLIIILLVGLITFGGGSSSGRAGG